MALSAPLFARKRVVQVLKEAAKGTAESAGLQDLLAEIAEINTTAPFIERGGRGLYLGPNAAGVIGEQTGVSRLRAELRGNGTAAMDEAISELLQGCGLKNTAEVYQVHSSHANQETVTLLHFEDGVKKSLFGAMGNPIFEGEFGKQVFCDFEFKGCWAAPVDAALPAATPSTEAPPMLKSATFTLAAQSIQIASFRLNLGNVVVPRPDVDAASGVIYYMITSYNPIIEMEVEADLVAGYDYFGAWLAGTEAAVSLAIGSGAGKAITISLPKVQYREIVDGDREGIQVYNITGQCNNDSGDDCVVITVTTA